MRTSGRIIRIKRYKVFVSLDRGCGTRQVSRSPESRSPNTGQVPRLQLQPITLQIQGVSFGRLYNVLGVSTNSGLQTTDYSCYSSNFITIMCGEVTNLATILMGLNLVERQLLITNSKFSGLNGLIFTTTLHRYYQHPNTYYWCHPPLRFMNFTIKVMNMFTS